PASKPLPGRRPRRPTRASAASEPAFDWGYPPAAVPPVPQVREAALALAVVLPEDQEIAGGSAVFRGSWLGISSDSIARKRSRASAVRHFTVPVGSSRTEAISL